MKISIVGQCLRLPAALLALFALLSLLTPITTMAEGADLPPEDQALLEKLQAEGQDSEKLKTILNDLADTNARIRSSAVQLLWLEAGEASLAQMLRMMDDQDDGVLYSAARSILETDTPEGNAAIRASLSSPEILPSYKAQVMSLLGEKSDRRFLPEMGVLLSDKNPSLRRTVLESMRAIGSPDSFRYFMAATTDANPQVATTAVGCLAQAGNPAALPRIATLLDTPDERLRATVAGAIPRLGGTEKYKATLLKLAGGESTMIIQNLVNGLASSPSPAGVEILAVLVARSETTLRVYSIRALKVHHSKDADNLLAGLLKDEEPRVRASAAQALGDKGAVAFESRIASLSKDPDPSVRIAVAMAIGALATDSGLQQLTAMIEDPDPAVRTVVTSAAAKISGPGSLGILKSASIDTDSYVRAEAIRGLASLGTEPALVVIRKMILDSEMHVKITAINELGRIGDTGAREALMKAKGDEREVVRKAARTALSLLP